jgi:hypothetical protein
LVRSSPPPKWLSDFPLPIERRHSEVPQSPLAQRHQLFATPVSSSPFNDAGHSRQLDVSGEAPENVSHGETAPRGFEVSTSPPTEDFSKFAHDSNCKTVPDFMKEDF